jgi:hypothetical protein
MSRHTHDKRKPADSTPAIIHTPSPAPGSTLQRQPAAFEPAAPEAPGLSGVPLSTHFFGNISLFPPESTSGASAGGGPTVQASLRVSAPGDPYEQEAERVADSVMRMPAGPDAERGTGADMPSYYIQRSPSGAGADVSPQVESSIGQMQGGGQPLPAGERTFFEGRFGHDFSNIRIHADDHAAQTAQSLNARAFTVGSDIAFDSGEYQPGTDSGRHLLAHELTHTIQQTGGVAAKSVQRKLTISQAKDGQVVAKGTSERPPGPLTGGSQGDHTTPFVTLQHQLINAVQDLPPADAWHNLVETHKHYKTLPGYDLSAKWLIKQSDALLATNETVDTTKVDATHVESYANDLLTIRNGLKYTSLPTTGGSTGGNNESNTAGGLHWLEGELRRGKGTKFSQADAIKTMWDTFDGVRYQTLTNATDQANILKQHIATVLDAYPTVTQHFTLTPKLLEDNCPY